MVVSRRNLLPPDPAVAVIPPLPDHSAMSAGPEDPASGSPADPRDAPVAAVRRGRLRPVGSAGDQGEATTCAVEPLMASVKRGLAAVSRGDVVGLTQTRGPSAPRPSPAGRRGSDFLERKGGAAIKLGVRVWVRGCRRPFPRALGAGRREPHWNANLSDSGWPRRECPTPVRPPTALKSEKASRCAAASGAAALRGARHERRSDPLRPARYRRFGPIIIARCRM